MGEKAKIELIGNPPKEEGKTYVLLEKKSYLDLLKKIEWLQVVCESRADVGQRARYLGRDELEAEVERLRVEEDKNCEYEKAMRQTLRDQLRDQAKEIKRLQSEKDCVDKALVDEEGRNMKERCNELEVEIERLRAELTEKEE